MKDKLPGILVSKEVFSNVLSGGASRDRFQRLANMGVRAFVVRELLDGTCDPDGFHKVTGREQSFAPALR